MSDVDLLTNATIVGAFRESDGSLLLETPTELWRATPEGACCSTCYIQHVSGSEALVGATIAEVEHVGGETRDDGHGGVVDEWLYRLRTSRGWCTIEMRLEHNGYYGGWLNVARVDCGHEDCQATPSLMRACIGADTKPLEDF